MTPAEQRSRGITHLVTNSDTSPVQYWLSDRKVIVKVEKEGDRYNYEQNKVVTWLRVTEILDSKTTVSTECRLSDAADEVAKILRRRTTRITLDNLVF